MGLKVFNSLPGYIKESFQNSNKFKLVLKNFISSDYFYTLEEYCSHSSI
jgi:hypothetical protein